ncbi:nuclear transport factor 2 family protein [Povalibacter sp.]|uniref:nuclear transport factor 2 family protein n=1 Tax=Povalibacter sp. TaxID=1962978 RepID=UPI002F3EAD6E
MSKPTVSQSPLDARIAPAALRVFRRYVTGLVNCHDFSVLPEIMGEDYTLVTSGTVVTGRDGPYRDAVAKQFAQFPGLQFTLHELVVCGDRVCARFTEHGASLRHDGARASWPSIAIYETSNGVLTRCSIEQDYYSRRRQLEQRQAVAVDPPAIAPWDEAAQSPSSSAEAIVRDWLRSGAWKRDPAVRVDDSHATGNIETVIDTRDVEVSTIVSGGDHVGFHALEVGVLASDFAKSTGATLGQPVSMPLSGLVRLSGGRVVGGHVIRDRWGLFRKLSRV